MREIRTARIRTPWTMLLGCVFIVVVAALPATAQGGIVASEASCPGQQNTHASERKQEHAMRCLIDHARSASTKSHRALERAAGRKVGDLFDCGFSHTACGRCPDPVCPRRGSRPVSSLRSPTRSRIASGRCRTSARRPCG